jgi:alcohol dehydrogenase class IV
MDTTAFRHQSFSQVVLFGNGRRVELPALIEQLGFDRCLVLSTPEQRADADALAEMLGLAAVGVLAQAAMHTPVEVSNAAAAHARDLTADSTIGIGGGSTIGLGKAISLRTGLPQVAVPTTYAGSECTPIIGETANGEKKTQRNPVVVPAAVVYDPELTLTLPAKSSGMSGMNALAHAVEALYSPERSPLLAEVAGEGIRSLARALPRVVEAPSDRDARADALYGAWLCGTCLATSAMALHHKICHVLGGLFDLPHAETHALVLPYIVAFNKPAAADAVERLAGALGADDPVAALFDLAGAVGAPRSLAELGMPEDGIDAAVDLILADRYWNPRPLTRPDVERLVRTMYEGFPDGVPG